MTLWSRACGAFELRRIAAQFKTENAALRANLPTVRIVLVQRFALTVRLAPCPRPWGAMELPRSGEKGVVSWVLHSILRVDEACGEGAPLPFRVYYTCHADGREARKRAISRP